MSDLFQEFKETNAKEWKNLVQSELKGEDYNQTLCWETEEGFQVKPLYTNDDVSNSQLLVSKNNWKIITSFLPSYQIPYDRVDGVFLNENQTTEYLPTTTELLIVQVENGLPNLTPLNQNTYLDWSVLTDLAIYGDWPNGNESEALNQLKNLQNSAYIKSICVSISPFQNSGANDIEQLALAISMANEYAELIGNQALEQIWIKNAVGNNFFFEIAKLRSLRILWNQLCEVRNQTSELFILSESSLRNKSAMDKHNNIIRTTFEAAAAILGNSDGVKIYPYDELFVQEKESSLETGIKQQFVLREESFLNEYVDPLQNAYYVEYLTSQMTNKAWNLFKKWESEGGYIACLKKGNIQQQIAQTAKKEQQQFDENKFNLIGVNKFPKKDDDFVQFELKKTVLNSQKVLFQTIKPQRLSEKVEMQYDQG